LRRRILVVKLKLGRRILVVKENFAFKPKNNLTMKIKSVSLKFNSIDSGIR
jgi:hypothetical protein